MTQLLSGISDDALEPLRTASAVCSPEGMSQRSTGSTLAYSNRAHPGSNQRRRAQPLHVQSIAVPKASRSSFGRDVRGLDDLRPLAPHSPPEDHHSPHPPPPPLNHPPPPRPPVPVWGERTALTAAALPPRSCSPAASALRRTSASATAALSSAFSRSTMGAGVPAGASMPYQP